MQRFAVYALGVSVGACFHHQLSQSSYQRTAHSRTPELDGLTSSLSHVALAATSAVIEPETEEVVENRTSASWKEKTFGRYENRLREMSAPEKVFEYFASQDKGGKEVFMTPYDFARCITPYTFGSQSDVGLASDVVQRETPESLAKLMEIIDADSDGLISFHEFIFFTTLLSIPKKYFRVAFKMTDENGDGMVDYPEFVQVMKVMHSHNPLSRSTRKPQGWTPEHSQEQVWKIDAWFGQDGKGRVNVDEFETFLNDLHKGVSELRFLSLSSGADTIAASEFVVSLLAFSVQKNLEQLTGKVRDRLASSNVRVDFEEYHKWHEALSRMDEIEHALTIYLATGSAFTMDDFQRAVLAVTGIRLKQAHLDAVLAAFDDDGNGILEREEFLDVIRPAASSGLNKPRDFGVGRFIRCFKGCSSKT